MLTPLEASLVDALDRVNSELVMALENSRELPGSFVDDQLNPWVQCRQVTHVHAELAPIPGPFYTRVVMLINGDRMATGECKMRGDIIRNSGEYGK